MNKVDIQGQDILDFFANTVREKKWPYLRKMSTTEENNRDRKHPGYTAIAAWMKTNGLSYFLTKQSHLINLKNKERALIELEDRLKSVYADARIQKGPITSLKHYVKYVSEWTVSTM